MPTNTQDQQEVETAPVVAEETTSNAAEEPTLTEEVPTVSEEVTTTVTEEPIVTETAPVVAEETTSDVAAEPTLTEEVVPPVSEEVTSTVTEEPIVTEPVTETAPAVAEETTSDAAAEPTLTEEVVPPASEEVTTTVTEEPIVTEPITETAPIVAEATTSNAAEGSAPGENTGGLPDHNAIMDPINEDELKNSLATITDLGTKATVLFGYNSRVGLGTLSAETQINLAETVAATKDKILFESLTNQVARNTAIKVACKLYNL